MLNIIAGRHTTQGCTNVMLNVPWLPLLTTSS